MLTRKLSICFIFLFMSFFGFGQTTEIDSLQSILKTSREDSLKVKTLLALSRKLVNSAPERAIEFANQAKDLSFKIDYQKGLAYAYKFIGIGYFNKALYADALIQYKSSLLLFELLKDKKGIANLYSNIGNIYYNSGDNSKAVDLYLKSLKIAEEINDTARIAALTTNLGAIYMSKRSTYYKALEYNLRALKQGKLLNDNSIIGGAALNIGTVYYDQGNRKEALKYYSESLQAYEGTIDYSSTLNAIGQTYFKNKDFTSSLKYFEQALQTAEKFDDKLEMTKALAGIGATHFKKKDYKLSLNSYNKAKEYAEEIGAKEQLVDIYKGISTASNAVGNFEDAYHYHSLYSIIKDSIYNIESDKKTAFLQGTFDLEKKQSQIDLLEKDKELSTKEIKSKKSIQIALLAFLSAVSVLLVFVYRFYIIKKKSNIELEEKNKKIESQKSEITKSIEYAKKIQDAMLPEEDLIEEVLYNSFLIYRPKDIVSGDFYVCINENKKIFLAVADCTGHGVPGALMSMIGSNILNKLVTDKGLTDPTEILEQLNTELIIALKQNKNEGNDGMDIAICVIDFNEGNLQFAGAYRPLWMIRDNELEEIKGSKFPIGGHQIHDERQFKTHTIQISKNDRFYIFTDGFADQFGGDSGKKLTTRKLKEYLVSTKSENIKKQGTSLTNFFENWKGRNEQLDDVCFIGFEVI